MARQSFRNSAPASSVVEGDKGGGDALAKLKADMEALRAENAALREQVAAPMIREIDKPKKSGTVTVACKIPCGLRLQLQHEQKTRVPTGRGGEMAWDTQMVFGGQAIHVFGPSIPAGHVDNYIMPKMIEGGYALTPGIPASFWEMWLEQNQLADYVVNNMIFAYDGASAKAAAREKDELKSGLEPLSRDVDAKGRMKDRRVPKPATGSVARIGYDAERDAERAGRVFEEA